MIKATCDHRNTNLSIKGSISEIVAELCIIIGKIYTEICDSDEAIGAAFKELMQKRVMTVAFMSEEEFEKFFEEEEAKQKKTKQDMNSAAKDVKSELRRLVK